MSVIGSEILAGASGNQGYFIQKSLRFRSSASAYLSRTPASAGNRKTWTWSGWVKRGLFGEQYLLSATSNGTTTSWLKFTGNNTLELLEFNGSSFPANIATNAVYRDASSWYHVVYAFDSTQATEANRLKIYVNGNQQTLTGTYPSLNLDSYINGNWTHTICKEARGAYYGDQYLTEVNFIDGQALTPSSFGEYSTQTGVWQAKKYSGTYGTNGFYLPFSNNSSTTTIGYDFSGNGNNWTTNNISLTSGSTYDSMVDVPTVGELASNFCVVNPLNKSSGAAISDGNLTVSGLNTAAIQGTVGTFAVSSGKYYFECAASNIYTVFGITKVTNSLSVSCTTQVGAGNAYSYYGYNGQKYNGSVGSAYGATFTSGDIIGCAFDLDNGSITFYKNNTSQGVAYTWTPDGSLFTPTIQGDGSGLTGTCYANFGQRPFAYTPPTGFKALNTYNLPTPTIGATPSSQANKYFDILQHTGGASASQDVTGLQFQPDFIWIKSRTGSRHHALFDAVRGANQGIYSSLTYSQNTWSGQSFLSNGYRVDRTFSGETNSNGDTYVDWAWKANGSGSSNTSGSITSTVSANTTSGFSVVTYTGNGTNATVGHGLGVAPKMILFKNRSVSSDWAVYHGALGATYEGSLNTTAAFYTSGTEFQGTNPTSSVFYINGGFGVNNSGNSMVAYCFAEVAGFSKFGSYTGNGSSDGPFVYLGFRPRYIMWKCAGSATNWGIQDTSRSTFNAASKFLFPNDSSAEVDSPVSYSVDIVSNGFKIRATGNETNINGQTYIYMAFAENPFKYSLAR